MTKPVIVDKNTQASAPGGIVVDFKQYFRCFPTNLLIWACFVFAVIGCFFIDSVTIGIIGLLFLPVGFWYTLRQIKEQFLFGDTCAGVVLSHDPPLIAVATDMSSDGTHQDPVIKVLSHPLGKFHGGTPAIGERIATVALYAGPETEGHWADFNPTAVRCASTDDKALANVLSRIPEEEWKHLESGLAKLPKPAKPKLYWLNQM